RQVAGRAFLSQRIAFLDDPADNDGVARTNAQFRFKRTVAGEGQLDAGPADIQSVHVDQVLQVDLEIAVDGTGIPGALDIERQTRLQLLGFNRNVIRRGNADRAGNLGDVILAVAHAQLGAGTGQHR